MEVPFPCLLVHNSTLDKNITHFKYTQTQKHRLELKQTQIITITFFTEVKMGRVEDD